MHTCPWIFGANYSCACHDSFTCATSLIPMCVTWLIHSTIIMHTCPWIFGANYSCACHDSFTCATSLIPMCVTWLIHTCDITHSWIFCTNHSVALNVRTLFFLALLVHVCWSKETPPPGGVSYLLCSLIKNTEEEDPPQSYWNKFFEGGPLPPGSW